MTCLDIFNFGIFILVCAVFVMALKTVYQDFKGKRND
jgi:hypothetical protein